MFMCCAAILVKLGLVGIFRLSDLEIHSSKTFQLGTQKFPLGLECMTIKMRLQKPVANVKGSIIFMTISSLVGIKVLMANLIRFYID